MHTHKIRVLPELGDEAERNRFDRISAVAADGRHAVHRRCGNVRIRIDVHDAFDRIDRRNAVCPAPLCGLRGFLHPHDVRRQLGKDRLLRAPSCGGGELFDTRGILTDIRSQSAVFHIRAGEVQFDRIRAVLIT